MSGFGVATAGAATSSLVTSPAVAVSVSGTPFLLDLSCASAGNCTAVGADLVNSTAIVSTETNGSFSAEAAVALPADAVPGEDPDLSSVSCTSVGNCVAMGDYSNSTNDEPMIAFETNGTFGVAATVLLPPDAATSGQSVEILGGSCPSAGSCTFVGTYQSVSNGAEALAVTVSGGTVTSTTLPVPSDAATGTNADVFMNSVSCASAGNCTLVGAYEDNNALATFAFVVTESGGSFSNPTTISGPDPSDTDISLTSVSCQTVGNCTAVGNYVDASGNFLPMTDVMTNGAFAPATTFALPSNAAPTGQYAFIQVGCISVGNCLITGFYIDTATNGDAITASEVGGSFSSASVVTLPSDANAAPGASFSMISCIPGSTCQALGMYRNTASNPELMSISAALPVAVTTTSLPSGTVGHAYSATIAASGGSGHFAYSVTSGTLPAGLTLNSSTGAISGTPTAAGSPSLTFTASDAGPPVQSATSVITLTIAPGIAPVPDGVATASFGTPVTQTVSSTGSTVISASDSNGAATVTVPLGALPAGTVVSVYPVTNTAALAAQLPAGKGYLLGFAIAWVAPNGTSPNAIFPITMTVTNSSINKGDSIYVATSTRLVLAGTATKHGTVTLTFSVDPTFVIAATPNVTLLHSTGVLSSKGDALTLRCQAGVACVGNARLTVTRKHKVGKKTVVTQVALATGHFSIRSGASKKVEFTLTQAGKATLSGKTFHKGFRMGFVTAISGGTRVVSATFLK